MPIEPRSPDLDILGFLTAFGEEFCEALSPPVSQDAICPNDAYELWARAFGAAPTFGSLAAISKPELQRMRDECERYFECPELRIEHLAVAIAMTLQRWTSGESDQPVV
jgi:hypothetical protein